MKKNERLQQLTNAYQRLRESLEFPLSEPLVLDAAIQRFEFTFELAWKTLKIILEDQGLLCHSPKSCLKEAFKMGWIHDEENWIGLLKARNMTSHVYDEGMARDIYKTIKDKHHLFQSLILALNAIQLSEL